MNISGVSSNRTFLVSLVSWSFTHWTRQLWCGLSEIVVRCLRIKEIDANINKEWWINILKRFWEWVLQNILSEFGTTPFCNLNAQIESHNIYSKIEKHIREAIRRGYNRLLSKKKLFFLMKRQCVTESTTSIVT